MHLWETETNGFTGMYIMAIMYTQENVEVCTTYFKQTFCVPFYSVHIVMKAALSYDCWTFMNDNLKIFEELVCKVQHVLFRNLISLQSAFFITNGYQLFIIKFKEVTIFLIHYNSICWNKN